MKTNLKNDIYTIRYLIPIFFHIAVLYTLIHKQDRGEGLFDIALPLIYAASTPIVMFFTDERCKWGGFAAGLPGKRSGYIHAKYIVTIASDFLLTAASLICYLIRIFITGQNDLNIQIPVFVLGFSAALVMCALSMPIMTHFGAKVGIGLYFVLMAILGIISGYYEAMLEDGAASVPDLNFSLPVMGAALLTYLLSWSFSLLVYKYKEL